MMEYSSNLNLDLHHQDDHLHGTYSSSLALQGWNQDLLLNSGGEFSNGALSSSRDHFVTASSIQEMPMVQDLGFQWGPSAGGSHGEGYNMMNMNHSSSSSSSHQGLGFHLSKDNIKDGLSISDSFAKLTGINIQDYSTLMPNSMGFEQKNLGTSNGRPGSFSIVLPTANISGSGITQSLYPTSLGMDLQALDLLASARFGRTMSQPSLDSMALLREDLAYSLGQLQEPPQTQVSTTHHKASLSVSGVTEANGSNSLDRRTSQPAAAKKPRFESRSSFTPFKVRKEKLGDRIAALQQLVAPFGKTDTASVLMEAIGYIKFLQDQVETLSVPYMRSSNYKKTRTPQGGSSEERDEPKPDLRSRGLCLVPLSCTSYVTNENGGVWSPPNYRGGTANM